MKFQSGFKIFKHKHGWTGLSTSSPLSDRRVFQVVVLIME